MGVERHGGLEWEVFQKGTRGRAAAQIVLYRGTGMMAINETAFTAIGRPKGVLLLVNRAQGLIGIASYYGLLPGTYPVRFLDGMLIAKVSERRETRTGRPAKPDAAQNGGSAT